MAKKFSKKVVQIETVSKGKTPFVKENPDSYISKQPVWSFKNIDLEHERWSIRKRDSLFEDIIEKLKSFEGMTWQEIDSAAGGKSNGTNNHEENISSLEKEAQQRWRELKLDEYDHVYSLRCGGRVRIYGIREEGVLRIIWYDENHEICKSYKKHT